MQQKSCFTRKVVSLKILQMKGVHALPQITVISHCWCICCSVIVTSHKGEIIYDHSFWPQGVRNNHAYSLQQTSSSHLTLC